MAIKSTSIQRVKEAADIVEVVADFVSLKQKGKNYWACCPFHEEKSPSFSVNPALNIYKCFGCGVAGDAINFIIEHERFSFIEAIRYLAQKYNIELEEEQDSLQAQQEKSEQDVLYTILHFATHFFARKLSAPEGNIASAYLTERKVSTESKLDFKLGFAPDAWDEFLAAATQKGFNEKDLERAGLITMKEDGKKYDRFRNRIIFPIRNLAGKTIAFGARKMGSKDPGPKYLNSPETAVYDKGSVLYGLDMAKNSIRQTGTALLTEGYLDVISLVEAGFSNVVASSGTAFTTKQATLLKRFAEKVVILYDSDAAGQKAAFAVISILLQAGLEPSVIVFEEGEDPDSFLKRKGRAAMEEKLSNHQQDFLNFALSYAGFHSSNPFQKSKAIFSALELITHIPGRLERQASVHQLALLTSYKEEELTQEFNTLLFQRAKEDQRREIREYSSREIKGDVPIKDEQVERLAKKTFTHHENEALRLVINFGRTELEGSQFGVLLLKELAHLTFASETLEQLKNSLLKIVDEVGHLPETHQILQHLDGDVLKQAIDLTQAVVELSKLWHEKHEIYIETEESNLQHYATQNLLHLKLEVLGKMLEELFKQISEADSAEDKLALLKEFQALKKEEGKVASQLGIRVG